MKKVQESRRRKQKNFGEYDPNWGGKRSGSGRPRKEPTKPVRLPLKIVEQLPLLVKLADTRIIEDLRSLPTHSISVEGQEEKVIFVNDLAKIIDVLDKKDV